MYNFLKDTYSTTKKLCVCYRKICYIKVALQKFSYVRIFMKSCHYSLSIKMSKNDLNVIRNYGNKCLTKYYVLLVQLCNRLKMMNYGNIFLNEKGSSGVY